MSDKAGHRSRLRQRLLTAGGKALADYEVLEMMLFAAHPRGDVKPLAKKLIKHFGSFAGVLKADVAELQTIDGVGDAAIAAIKIAFESSQRVLKDKVEKKPIIKSWTALLQYCQINLAHKKIEEFHVFYLNKGFELIADEQMQSGTVDHTPVYPREIVKRALELGATSVILAHNHPSGNLTPSKADIDVTNDIIDALHTVEIKLYDHVIISKQGHYSFKSGGII